MRVTAFEVTNTSGKHNKFYRIYVLDNGLEIRQWGKIGTRGMFKENRHSSVTFASLSARDKIDEEIMKGYRNKETREFDLSDSIFVSQQTLVDGWTRAQHQPAHAPDTKVVWTREDSYQQILWETA